MKAVSKLWLIFGLVLIFQDLLKVLFKLEFLTFIDEIAFLIVAIIIVLTKALKKEFRIDNVVIIAFTIFVFGIILEISKSNPRFESIIYVLYGLKIYFMYLIAQNLDISKKDYVKILDWFGYVFLAFGIIGILNYITGNVFLQSLGFESYTRYGFTRITGFFIHPHPLGWMAAIFAFYFILKYLFIEKSKNNLLFFGLSLFILGLTNNRKSMIGLILAGGVVYLLFIRKQISAKLNKRIVVGVLLLFLFITIFYLSTILEIVNFTKSEYIDSGDTPRAILYKTGFQIMMDNFPLGSGVATFGTIGSLRPYSNIYYEYGLNNIYGFAPNEPIYVNDAFWASMMGEQGIIGIILFVILLGLIFYKLMKKPKNTASRFEDFFVALSVFLLIEGVIESFVSPTFFYLLYLYFIFGIIGFTLNIKRTRSGITKSISQNRKLKD